MSFISYCARKGENLDYLLIGALETKLWVMEETEVVGVNSPGFATPESAPSSSSSSLC